MSFQAKQREEQALTLRRRWQHCRREEQESSKQSWGVAVVHETHAALHTLFDCLVQRLTEKTDFPRLTLIPGLPGCVTPCLELKPHLILLIITVCLWQVDLAT